MEAGTITNRHKLVDRGITVAGLVMGTCRLFDYVDGNPFVAVRGTTYTHDLEVLASLPAFTALNSAVQVDRTGAINAESIGARYVGAVGGAGDFLRGAHHSPGGLPMMVLPSLAKGQSRTVSRLDGPVSTARADAGLVVTEHGVADLRGATISERVERMLEVADPGHRAALSDEAAVPRPCRMARPHCGIIIRMKLPFSAPADAATEAPARSFRHLLLDRAFGPFFVGKLLSTAGVWIYNIVGAILVHDLTGSAFMVGLVSIMQFGPQLLLAPLSGAIADRMDRLVLLVAGRFVVATGSGGLAAWIWLVGGPEGLPGVWPVVLAAGVVGIGFVIVAPSQHALLPNLVRRNELASAIELTAIPPTLARAGGPAVGAMVAVSFGPAVAFMLASLANLVAAAILWTIAVDGRPELRQGTDRSIRAGFLHLRVDPVIVRLLAGVAAVAIAGDPIVTLTPSLSEELGHGATLVGVFASSFGTGAVITFVGLRALRERIGQAWVATAGLLLMAGGNAAAGVAGTPVLVILSLATAGAGMTFAFTSLSTQIQVRLPDVLRGRVMALWSIAFIGSRPIGAAVDGAVADATSVGTAFLVLALVIAATAWACRPSRITPLPDGIVPARALMRSDATPAQ